MEPITLFVIYISGLLLEGGDSFKRLLPKNTTICRQKF